MLGFLPRFISAVLLMFFLISTVSAETVEEEINFLIEQVANTDCQFIRNGDSHDAQGAADHLRLKYRRGKRYASSAENFIDRLASESSWSGKLYYIVCPDSGEHTANAWLHAALEAHRAE